GLAAVGRDLAGLLRERALGARGRGAHQALARLAGLRAEAVATLIAGLARAAVGAAGVERPEAAGVAGEELLRRQVEGRMARVGAALGAELDGGHPQLLGGDVVDEIDAAGIATERRDGGDVAVQPPASEDDPGIAARSDRVDGGLVVEVLV